MISFPFDVFMEILPLVDFTDLAAMAATNKDLSAYALDRMYQHIVSKNMQRACESIASNPSLAQRVQSLEINRSDHGANIETILPALRDALRNTRNLRTLKLDVDGQHSWILTPSLGVFKLRSFSSMSYTDQPLLDFLHHQTELEELRLAHSFIESQSPVPWDFPHLKKFDGPMSWIEVVVPRHPVSHVIVTHVSSVYGTLAAMGMTTAPIRHLQIPFHAMHKRTYEELKILFPALVDLTITNDAVPHNQTIVSSLSAWVQGWLQGLLAAISTVESVCLLGYDLTDECDEETVRKMTERAPAVRKFSLQDRGLGSGRNSRMIHWERRSSGWEVRQ
ncbi:hypothetical protein DFH07DRAFT_816341 [Mycena maculata]|uniref:F-box domain-containing protein n=1 Tax=Mycena maculata TaxID=230809 RepID=A0AAD7NHI2_9AGAR|nr:hypothetical protein DFH07DRAFT_816341 [Mycena maculata]